MTKELLADDLVLFAYIAETGSFTAAAELVGMQKATLSRRLTRLEKHFGERLIQRSTRRLVLTEFGQRMLEHARRVQEEAEIAVELAQNRQVAPRGTLRASFPPEYRELGLVEVISTFASRYPQLALELDLSPRRVDIVAERFDLAVRAATSLPDDSALVARNVGRLQNALYASPNYLARRGTPERPDELAEHTALALTAGGSPQDWLLTRDDEEWQGLPRHTLAANSLGLQQALAVQGHGIVPLSEQFAAPLVEQGELQRVLPGWALPPITIWCVTPGRSLLPQRTLAFMETLRDVLGRDT